MKRVLEQPFPHGYVRVQEDDLKTGSPLLGGTILGWECLGICGLGDIHRHYLDLASSTLYDLVCVLLRNDLGEEYETHLILLRGKMTTRKEMVASI